MTNFVKITLVSLAVLAGASAAQAGSGDSGSYIDTFLEQQKRMGA